MLLSANEAGVYSVHNDVSGMLIIFSLHISSSLFRCSHSGSPKPTECPSKPRRSNSAYLLYSQWPYPEHEICLAVWSKDHRGQLTCLVGSITGNIFMHCDKRDANLFVCLSHSKR